MFNKDSGWVISQEQVQVGTRITDDVIKTLSADCQDHQEVVLHTFQISSSLLPLA